MKGALGRSIRVATAIVAIVLFAAGIAWFWLRGHGRPLRAGAATIPGLSAPVSVRFDRWATPYVTAASSRDLAAALGYLHANDRLFQMELGRRAAAGRLSELFGERALDFDRSMRRLRFRRLAQELLDQASAQTRGWLEAYAAGVNAWLAERGSDLPPEFVLLRARPEPWTPLDSLSFSYLMAESLSPIVNPDENEAFDLLRAFGADRARELLGAPEAVVFPEIAALAKTLAAKPRDPRGRAEGAGLGSNNWAISPDRSASHHALVANDPHLHLALPGVWFQAALRSPDYEAAGMTIPGAPGIVLGRGPAVAWACTNLYVDDVDVFFEEVDPGGVNVRRGDGWRKIESVDETIRLRDGRTESVRVRWTDRGTFFDADPERGLPPRSVEWSGLARGDQLAAFANLARARGVADVAAAIEPYGFPAQNLVVGDRDGHLMWTPLGRAPDRFGWDGHFPAPGARTDVGWRGLLPAASNPSLEDPKSGLVATANSFLPVEQPAWFQGDFDTPFRADRIREVLATRHDWSIADLARLESDTTSLWAKRLIADLGSGFSGDAGKAIAALHAWNFEMAPTGAATLFALVERHLQQSIFEDEAEQAHIPRFGTRWRLMRLLEGKLSTAWFDDVSTPGIEDRSTTLSRALGDAWHDGVSRFGEDVARWPYAAIHTLTLAHPMSSVPVVGRLWSRGPIELPGSATTILAFGGPWHGNRLNVSYGPSMRLLNDAAAPDAAISILPGGESGDPFDPHYDDQLALYLAGETRPFPWSDEAIAHATVSTLELRPPAGAAALSH